MKSSRHGDPTILQKILRIHPLLFTLMLAMGVASVFFINSATHMSENPDLQQAASQQVMWLIIGFGVFTALIFLNYEVLIRYGLPIYILALTALIAVLVFGREVNGAKSWIRIGGVGVQPAELCKIAYTCGLAWLLVWQKDHIKKLWMILAVLAFSAVPVGLILLQPDFGSASVYGPITFAMLLVGGARKRYLALPLIGAVAVYLICFVWVYKMDNGLPGLKTYQNNRIRTFFNPDIDPLGSGWTIRQSLIAVGSGGLKGKGYLQGDQNIYGFLPKNIAYNDFIFSVIAEEFGFAGGCLLIVCHGLVILCIIHVASRAKDLGGALLAAGVAGMWFTHFFINIGMTIKVVPITGIPLPLTSYGGTFLVTCMAGLGIVQSVWIHRRTY